MKKTASFQTTPFHYTKKYLYLSFGVAGFLFLMVPFLSNDLGPKELYYLKEKPSFNHSLFAQQITSAKNSRYTSRCLSGQDISQFEKEICDKITLFFLLRVLILCSPLLLGYSFYRLLTLTVRRIYASLLSLVSETEKHQIMTVINTDKVGLDRDRFFSVYGFLLHLNPVWAEDQRQKLYLVWMSPNIPLPQTGQKISVYQKTSLSTGLQTRHFGSIDDTALAVIIS